jgi:IPT/TIG domain/Putative Ig domain
MNRLIWLALASIVLVAGCGVQTPLEVDTNTLPNAALWQTYKVQLRAFGGTQPVQWSVASGQLPPGVVLSGTGLISGTPLSEGEFDFIVQVSEALLPGVIARSPNLKIKVRRQSQNGPLAITTTALAGGTVQAPYGAVLSATGGSTPYKWSLAAGSLPPGIALNASTGVLAGTPTASGYFSFTAEARDSSAPPQRATKALTISVASATSPLQISTSSLPAGAVQVAYNSTLSATGGTLPYSWSVIGGTFPPGLALSASTGTIMGTPAQAGTFLFTLQVKDSRGQTASSSFSANIAPLASPVVSSFSPTSGPTSGGTTVTINGSNFAAGAAVSFGGVAAAATLVGAGQIRAVAPAHIAGTVGISVQENGQTGTSSSGFTYNAVTPTVSGISPSSGPTAGGTTVTINGSNFLAGAVVLFGTASASNVAVVSSSQIQATAPPNAAGAVNVVVENPGNLSATLSGGFTYNPPTSGPLTISSIAPTSGPPGTTVTITGTNFETGATAAFGSTDATSVSFVSSTQLQVSVPSLSTGTYNVTVTNPDPASATLNSGFTVTATESLLAGCTVNSTNTPSCSTPAGYTLLDAQGFETGSLNSGESFLNTAITTAGGSGCSAAHTGTHSASGTVASGESQVGFVLPPTSFTTMVVSWWECDDANQTFNDEMYGARLVNSAGTQALVEDWDSCDTGNSACGIGFNARQTRFTLYNEQCPTGACVGPNGGSSGYTLFSPNQGTWTQYEWHITPNTSGSSNGSFALYQNGVLLTQATNQNLQGATAMSPGYMQIGGVYTKLLWSTSTSSLVCPTSMIQGGAHEVSGEYVTNFAANTTADGSSCLSAGQGPTSTFKRYFDDIIVVYR